MRRAWMIPVSFLLAAAPATGAIPWDRIDGGGDLKGIYLEVAEEVLNTAPCYGGCGKTVAACLASNPDDKIARRIAAFVARRVRADKDESEILEEIEDRRLSAFPEQTYAPDLTGLIVSGDPKAPIQVVLYADFGCPYCRVTSIALRKRVVKQPKEIALYFKNYPLKAHEYAVPAALALLAAEKQGKFWEMHDALFEGDADLTRTRIDELAGKIGLDLAKLHADEKEKDLVARLRAEKMEGLQFGVEKTPGILVNGKFYRGVRTWEELRDRIEEEKEIIALGM
ncbi:MAG: thioredoxin domain-containing protein [Candidatus Eisenbacteria bacterium]